MLPKTMKHLNRESLPLYRERIQRIDSGDRPRFGTMSPAKALAHLRLFTEMSIGEYKTEIDVSNVITRSGLFFWFMVDVLPWPKGKVKAPEEFSPAPKEEFEEERRLLLEAMERFVAVLEKEPDRRQRSPLVGPITMRKWSRIHGKHFIHHLSQFGVED